MFIRILFKAYGKNFNAKECIEELISSELKVDYDEKYPNLLSFEHPKEFAKYWDEAYEKAYLEFISNNIHILKGLGAYDFEFVTDIYKYSDEQCNFEILSRGFLPYIGKYGISLPVSVYTIDEGHEPFM